jgi:hypothetical protein
MSLVVFEQSFLRVPVELSVADGLHSLYSHSGRYYDDFDNFDEGDYEVERATSKSAFFPGSGQDAASPASLGAQLSTY